jgi:hypothetical protein
MILAAGDDSEWCVSNVAYLHYPEDGVDGVARVRAHPHVAHEEVWHLDVDDGDELLPPAL